MQEPTLMKHTMISSEGISAALSEQNQYNPTKYPYERNNTLYKVLTMIHKDRQGIQGREEKPSKKISQVPNPILHSNAPTLEMTQPMKIPSRNEKKS